MVQSVTWLGVPSILQSTILWNKTEYMNTASGQITRFGDDILYPPSTYTVIGGGCWTAWWGNGGWYTPASDHSDMNWNIGGHWFSRFWMGSAHTIIYDTTASATITDQRFDYENSVYKWKFTTTTHDYISVYLYDIPSYDNRGSSIFTLYRGDKPLPTSFSVPAIVY